MNRATVFCLSLLAAGSVLGQNQPGTEPAAAPQAVPGSTQANPPPAQNQAAQGNLTMTNESGGTFTLSELSSQLQTLQASVNQTLPMVTAFNKQFGSANNNNNGLAGVLSGIFSRHGNTNSTSGTVTNLLGALGGLLNTNQNNGSSPSMNPEGLRNMQALQKDLEPLPPVLQALNGSSGASPANPGQSVVGHPAQGTNNYGQPPNGGLTPTGR